MTPTDPLAFVGDPPLPTWMPEADEVHVSVAFTWDIEEGQRLAAAWQQYYPIVRIGGPALDDPGNEFTPGLYLKYGITMTSRGCLRKCPWCFVPKREGKVRLLTVQDGSVIQDNNLLATPREHQTAVFQMLRKQSKAATFSGGLDARLVDDWTADQLRQLRIRRLFLAADTEDALAPLERAVGRLRFLGRDVLYCYVMIGHRGETIGDATKRLERVWALGCMPFAQLYRPLQGERPYSLAWRSLAREWSRPAIMRVKHAAQTRGWSN